MNRNRIEIRGDFPALANPAGVGDSGTAFRGFRSCLAPPTAIHGEPRCGSSDGGYLLWLCLFRLGLAICCAGLLNGCDKPQSAASTHTEQSRLDEELVLNLKAGRYSLDDPEWSVLQKFVDQADIYFSLSGHDGLSCGGASNLKDAQARELIAKLPRRRLAAIMLEKNYTSGQQHIELKALLKDAGFQAIVITQGGGSFTGLVDYTVFSRTSSTEAK